MAISFEHHKPKGTDYRKEKGKVVDEYGIDSEKEQVFLTKDLDKDFLKYLKDKSIDVSKVKKQWKEVYEELDDLYEDMFDDFAETYPGASDMGEEFRKMLIYLLDDRYKGPEKYEDFYDQYHDYYVDVLKQIDAVKNNLEYFQKLHTEFELGNLEKEVLSTKTVSLTENSEREMDYDGDIEDISASRFHVNEMAEVKINFGSMDTLNDNLGSDKVVNILNSKKKLKRVVYNVLKEEMKGHGKSDEEIKDMFKKRYFGLNLGMNGLAGLILYLKDNGGLTDGDWSGTKIKNLKPAFKFERSFFDMKWNERGKAAKILNAVKNNKDLKEELLEFASLVNDSGSVWKKSLKQRYNWQENVKQLDSDGSDILKSLCDYNQDGTLSANYFGDNVGEKPGNLSKASFKKRYGKERKKQRKKYKKDRKGRWARNKDKREQTRKNGFKDAIDGGVDQGDIGGLFGPQLYFSMVRAEATLNARIDNSAQYKANLKEKYGTDKLKGEHILIYNILKTTKIMNSSKELGKKLDKITRFPLKPYNLTQEKLLELTEEYTQFQPLFANSIVKMNGGADYVRYNLHDNLTGNFQERMNLAPNPYVAIENNLNEFLKTPEGKKLEQQLKADGFVEVKTTLLNQVITFFDHIEFQSTESGQIGSINKWFATGAREMSEYKQKMVGSLVRKFLGAMMRGEKIKDFPKNFTTLTIGPSFLRSKKSDDGKWNWNFKARAGLSLNLLNVKDPTNITDISNAANLEIYVGFGGERQINYRGVTSARLDDLKSSKYLGLEAVAGGDIGIMGGSLDIGAQVGLTANRRPEVAIDQRHTQFADMLAAITDFSKSPPIFNGISIGVDEIKNKDLINDVKVYKYMEKRFDKMKSIFEEKGYKGKPFLKFMENNEDYIKGTMKYMTKMMKEENVFKYLSASNLKAYYLKNKEEDSPKWSDLDPDTKKELLIDYKKNALSNMMAGVRTGVVEQSRQESLMQLHGTTKVTGARVGVSIPILGGTDAGGEGGLKIPAGLQIGAFYIGAKISTYLNYYTANAVQKEMVVDDIRDGSRAVDFVPNGDLKSMAGYLQGQLVYPGYGKIYGIEDKKDPLVEVKHKGGKILINVNEDYGMDLDDVLNVRALMDESVLNNVKWTENGLEIGDVGTIDVECMFDGQGVGYTLILGQKGTKKDGMSNTVRLGVGHNEEGTVESIENSGEIYWNKDVFQTEIVDEITGTGEDKAKKIMETIMDEYEFLTVDGKIGEIHNKKVEIDGIEYEIVCDDEGILVEYGTLLAEVDNTNNTIEFVYDSRPNAIPNDKKLLFDYKETISYTEWKWDNFEDLILDGSTLSTDVNAMKIVKPFFENMDVNSGKIEKLTTVDSKNVVFVPGDFDRDSEKLNTGKFIFTEKIDGKIYVEYFADASGLSIEYKEIGKQNPWSKAKIESEILSDDSDFGGRKGELLSFFNSDVPCKVNINGTWTEIFDGQIVFKKDASGDISVVYTPSANVSGGQLDISYEIVAIVGGVEIIKVYDSASEFCNFSGDLLDSLTILKDKESDLGEAENRGLKSYGLFLTHSLKIYNNDLEIDDEELKESCKNLRYILRNQNDDEYTKLKGFLADDYANYEVKMFIVDRFRALFSLEDKAYKNLKVDVLCNNKRGIRYEKLAGPESKFPDTLKGIRNTLFQDKDVWKQKFGEVKKTSKTYSNIFAYSASYRKGETQGYGMLPPGYVNVLSEDLMADESTLIEKGYDPKVIGNWFIKNLEVNKYEKELLIKQLERNIGNDIVIDDDTLRQLLTSEDKSIDIDNKKVILDFDRIFFLQGECANESMGLRINKITIETEREPGDGENYNGDGVNAPISREVESNKSKLENVDLEAKALGEPAEKPALLLADGTGVVTNILNTHVSDIELRHVMKVNEEEPTEPEDDITGSPGDDGEPEDEVTGSPGDDDLEGDPSGSPDDLEEDDEDPSGSPGDIDNSEEEFEDPEEDLDGTGDDSDNGDVGDDNGP